MIFSGLGFGLRNQHVDLKLLRCTAPKSKPARTRASNVPSTVYIEAQELSGDSLRNQLSQNE